ncbi:CdaA regulatory protein CdaR [Paenibacillus sp. CCS19]|uniref:CdaR family protein n=1 Tax=Paenibacillus sp. CCS19 TaxID=3158387 RepID=UPI00256C8DCE|nr:CdaR family protein [Paenibacillus cellulosilyticus]GMK42812.1 CdaA regulatory protein CdaR [Paenibacillus cellulosilyticus]
MDKYLAHPTALKILSVVVALLLWAVVHFDPESNSNSTMSTAVTHVIDTVKIKTIGLDEKTRALRSIDPGTVKLVVSGSRTRIAAAEPDDYVVSANLSRAPDGRSEVQLSVELPKGVELVQMTPNRAFVNIVPMQTKEFEVKVISEGQPANGYKVGEPIIKPNNRVHVTLPEDELADVGAVAVKVNVNGEEETVSEKKARVVVYDNDGNELKDAVVSPSVVEVEVPITKPYKTLPLQIGFSGALPDGLSIAKVTPSAQQVTVYGPQDVLDKLDYYDDVTVDLTKVTQSGSFTYAIEPMEGVASIDPTKITVTIDVEPTSERLIEQVPITLNSLAEGMTAKLLTPESNAIDIVVTGAQSLLGALQKADIQAVAKLDSLGVGQHEVPLDIHLPIYLHVNAPYNVTIDISDSKAASTSPKAPTVDTDKTDTGAGTEGGKQTDAGGSTDTSSPPPEAGDKGAGDGTGAGTSPGTGSSNTDAGTPADHSTSTGTDAGSVRLWSTVRRLAD